MAKKGTYSCIRACFHQGRFYYPGDTIVTTDPDRDLPHGKIGPKDKVAPIRHFVPADDFSVELVEKTAKEDIVAKKEPKIKAQKKEAAESPEG